MWTLIYIIIVLQTTNIFVAGGCGGYYTSINDRFTSENDPSDYPHHGRCGGYYSAMNDSFSSENYPSPYPHHSRCGYTIMVPEGYSITLTFTDFHVERDYDFVWVKENEMTLFNVTGSGENITSINSTGNSLFVYFTSDYIFSKKGFSATYYTNKVGRCVGYYGAMNDSFSSQNYPSPYPHHSRCGYTIMVPEGYSITLTFTDFHVERDYDFVWVKENEMTLFNVTGSGENITSINSTGNSLFVYFTSDYSVSKKGFSATYYTNRVGRCVGYYAAMNDSFSSQNYPSPYPHHSRCGYTIMVPEGYSITLTFTDFHVERNYDFVWVKENEMTLFNVTGSGENITSINSTGNSLFVYFTSDYSVSKKGFSATYYTNRVVNGGWSSWLNWTSCTVSCGGGISNRKRDCSNPAPLNGGTRCFGDSVESRVCNTNGCPVNGGWSSWSNRTSCNVSCGGGISTISRYCNDPAPLNGGSRCFGDSVESRVCNTNCCPVNGDWGMWSIWENCNVTCGFGIQQRKRACDNPHPVFGGFNCMGNDLQIQNCSTSPCPVAVDRNTQLYSSGVVAGVAVACIICTFVLCLIVHFTIRRLRQNKGRQEDRAAIIDGGVNCDEFGLIYANPGYIIPDNSQDDVCESTERPERNAEQNLYGNLKY